MSKDKPETKVVSAGRMSKDHFGAVNTPVYRASTILFPDLASMAPGKQLYTYGRRGTPGSKSLEDAIADVSQRLPTLLALEDKATTALIDGLDLEATHHIHTGMTEDHKEAARAFVENIRDIRDADPEGDAVQFAAEHPRFVA